MKREPWVGRVHGGVEHCAHGVPYKEICGDCWGLKQRELRTSKPLAARPRNEDMFLWEEWADRAEATIERLTADYQKCRIYYEAVKVERDRLRAELKEREEKFLIVHAQRDKYWMETYHLRTALQDMVRYAGDSDWNPDGVADAARRLLAGGSGHSDSTAAGSQSHRAQAIPCDSTQESRARPAGETSVGHPVVSCIFSEGCQAHPQCMNEGRCCARAALNGSAVQSDADTTIQRLQVSESETRG